MITGPYKYKGVDIPAACIQSIRLQVSVVPEPMLWFDGLLWGSAEAKESQDGPLDSLGIVRMTGVGSLPQIESLLAGQTRALLALGASPDMPDGALAGLQVGASIVAMDEYLLTLPEFAGWVRVP